MAKFIPNENAFVAFTLGPVGSVAAPASPTATAAAAEGDLPIATYDYKITGVNASGETVASTVATVTTTVIGGVTVAWTLSAGATGYRIYGRSSGSETLLVQVGDVATWLDSGAYTPGVEVPPTIATISNLDSPTVANIAEAVDLTRYATSVNFSSTGNSVPTPSLDSLFETSILGTSQAQATADFYKDDEINAAWDTLPRATVGYMFITDHGGVPDSGDIIEVWPVRVTSRTRSNLTSNTVVTFTATFAVPVEPVEDAVVV